MIQVTNVELSNFSRLSLPSKIFKYRSWKNPLHRRVLTHREIYFSSPEYFHDKYDCKIPIRYDLLDLNDAQKLVKFHNENWTRKQCRTFARIWMKDGRIRAMKTQKQVMKESFVNYGILSLTAVPNNNYMWQNYADDHEGFCIGFNTMILFEYLMNLGCGGGQVNYFDTLPIIYPLPLTGHKERHILSIFSKLKEWDFEKEYRLFKFSTTPLTELTRKVVLPVNCLSEIIMGNKMSNEHNKELIEAIPDELGNIIIKEENEL